jgi:hypothetical protein
VDETPDQEDEIRGEFHEFYDSREDGLCRNQQGGYFEYFPLVISLFSFVKPQN